MATAAILRYLAAPLRTAPLLLIVIFSFLLMLAAKAGLMGLPLTIILLPSFFKYAFVLLDHVADGVEEPPALAVEMINPVDDHRSLVLVALVVGLYFLSEAAFTRVGPMPAAAVALGSALILPAMIAVQGATGGIIQSLDPRTWFKLIMQLRGDYALVLACAVLFALMGHALVISQIGNALPSIVRVALLMYGWLAIFALIGGVLFERRLDIGLDASHAPERIRSRQIDSIYAQWRGGGHTNAWRTITTHLEKSADQ